MTYEKINQLKVEILNDLAHFETPHIMEKITKTIQTNESMNTEEKFIVREKLINAILKYDIIQPLLDDSDISEIMINGPNKIFVEKRGKILKTDIYFSDQQHIHQWIQKIATEVGREVNYGNPLMDARLKDGSRVNVILDPVAIDGPMVTIRKFNQVFNEPHELIQVGMFTEDVASFLELCIKSRFNLFICGGTGSGKTTLLNCLTSYINESERIIVIEDASEIQINHIPNAIFLETRTNQNIDHPIAMSDLIKNALRMRPDRIIVGEVRGCEVIDMLQAMNTGHEGSISTGHSNSSYDMLTRLEVISSSHSPIHHQLLRRQIISAIDLLIFVERTSQGTRRLTNISEVIKNRDDYTLNEIYSQNESSYCNLDALIGKVQQKEKFRRYSNALVR
ncbi:MAG: CpaF family protein [Clostridia bacterium]|nr:CpaF family protein [Clostridia bacterium]